VHERSSEMTEKFPHVPYLNSSLFEETDLELSRDGISIDRLREHQIKFYSKTVLKDNNGRRKTGEIEFLTYLFNFLDTYDFSTSVKHNKNDKNNLINAAVLGLIFEKINGYNEGSFYTPGRITMYMSRSAVRKAVVEKINKVKGWKCKNVYEIQFKISSLEEAKEINNIIDTLKICDPAVGSGHFLVSILNELIAVKSTLKVLIDTNGRSMNDIRCTVVNDELIIQDFNGDNFVYRRGNPDSERIQKAIFHEKRKLIENCLFGVDINPNSANICRLRLWIELLKNSYYYLEKKSNSHQLITLPNIDINIKVGNSLLHTFGINDKLDKRFVELKKYIEVVTEYKGTNDKRKKQKLIEQIKEIKQKFLSNIETPEKRKVLRLRKSLSKVGQADFFASKEERIKQRKEFTKLEKKLKQAMNEWEHSRQNPLFRKGLEWRVEFPEVLDDEGNFNGFDVVIANPPYIYSSYGVFSKSEKKYFEKEYPLSSYQANTFGLFLELSFKILADNGYSTMIIPNTFLTNNQYSALRTYLLDNTADVFILNSHDTIFEDAAVDNCIISTKISSPTSVKLAELRNGEVNLVNEISPERIARYNVINISAFKEEIRPDKVSASSILKSIDSNSKALEPNFAIVRDGLKVYQKGKGEPKQTQDDKAFKNLKAAREWFSDKKVDSDYWEIIKGEHIERYKITRGTQYLRYGRHLAEARNPDMFTGERLLIRQIPRKSAYSLTVMYTDKPIMHERSLISIRNINVEPYFILGILNSKVESYYALHQYDFLQRKTFPQLRLYQIKNLPIPTASSNEMKALANLVESQLNLQSITDPTEENIQEIKEINYAIDEYVMELYGLSDEQKELVREFTI
jgi:adenine-specific DNA-methyltransferase